MRIAIKRISLAAVLIAAALSIPSYQSFAKDKDDKQTSTSIPSSSEMGQRNGEQIFMDNCSRCHKPPMSIPPRITGTIVMHMRVRAKLSRQDEQALLRYLAP